MLYVIDKSYLSWPYSSTHFLRERLFIVIHQGHDREDPPIKIKILGGNKVIPQFGRDNCAGRLLFSPDEPINWILQ